MDKASFGSKMELVTKGSLNSGKNTGWVLQLTSKINNGQGNGFAGDFTANSNSYKIRKSKILVRPVVI